MGGLEGRLRAGTEFERILRKAGYEPEQRLDNPLALDSTTGVFLTRSPHATEPVVATIGQHGDMTIAARDRLLPFTAGENALRTLPRIYTIDQVTDDGITYLISPIQYLPPQKHKHMLEVLRVERDSFLDSMIRICEDHERLYKEGVIIEDRAIQNYCVEEGFRNPLHLDIARTVRPGHGARGTPGFVPPHLSPLQLEGTVTELTYSTAQVVLQAAEFHSLDLEEVRLVRDYVERYHAAPERELWIGDLRALLERPRSERAAKRAVRNSRLRTGAASALLLLTGGFAATTVLEERRAAEADRVHNEQVYAQSENAALDGFAMVDVRDTARVHALERELGSALGRKIAQLYTPVSGGGVLRAPLTDSAMMVPGLTGRDEAFDIGVFVHLPEGNAFTKMLYAAAEVDGRVLPTARAAARMQLNSLVKENALQPGLWNNLAVDALVHAYNDTRDVRFLAGVFRAASSVASMAEQSREANQEGVPVLPAHRWGNPIAEPLLLQHFDTHLIPATLLAAHDAQHLLRNDPSAAHALRTDTMYTRLLGSHAGFDVLAYDYLGLAQELVSRSYKNLLIDGRFVSARADWNGRWTRSPEVRSLGQALLAYASWEVAVRSEGDVAHDLRGQSIALEDVLLGLQSLPPQFLQNPPVRAAENVDASAAALAYRLARLQERPVEEYWPLLSRMLPLVPRATIAGEPRVSIYRKQPYLFADACALSSLWVCGVGTTTSASDFLYGLLEDPAR